MSLEARITAILSSPKPGAAPQVKTSAAFAARFSAEANRSGLTLDLAEDRAEATVRVCPTCGAQNSRFVTACFNCQTELDGRTAPPPAPLAQKGAGRRALPETRWQHIAAAPRISTLPLKPRSLTQARFAPPPPVARVEQGQVFSRFLEVFVEREAQRQNAPPPGVQRFDQRGALDKFLSVFVERHAGPAEAAEEKQTPEESGTFQKVLSLFVEKK